MKWIKTSIVLFILGITGCGNVMEKPVKMSFIACKDADAILLEGENNILIDTGESICREDVLSYLETENIDHIDLMILTHPDKDHIGNAVAIMEKWPVEKILATHYQKQSELEQELLNYVKNNKIEYEVVLSPKNIQLGETKLYIEPPLKNYDSSNNSSLLVWATIQDVTTFFGADIKKKRIEDLLEKKIQKANLVKIPYHGRYISNMDSLLKKLDPEFAIITAESLDPKTQQILEQLKINYEVNSETIVLEIEGKSWKMK